jgi:hypothetical protein
MLQKMTQGEVESVPFAVAVTVAVGAVSASSLNGRVVVKVSGCVGLQDDLGRLRK